jgi:hypothetical protein
MTHSLRPGGVTGHHTVQTIPGPLDLDGGGISWRRDRPGVTPSPSSRPLPPVLIMQTV